MSPSRDLTYCVSSLRLQAILAAVVSTDARGSLVTEQRPGDTISTLSGNRAQSTFCREWLLLTEDCGQRSQPSLRSLPELLLNLIPHCRSVLRFSFHELWHLSPPTLVMPDSLKCLPCPFLPTLLRGWFTSYCSLVMQPTCFHPPCACGPGEPRLLSQSSVLSHTIAALPAFQPQLGPEQANNKYLLHTHTQNTFQLLISPRWQTPWGQKAFCSKVPYVLIIVTNISWAFHMHDTLLDTLEGLSPLISPSYLWVILRLFPFWDKAVESWGKLSHLAKVMLL